MSDEAPAALPPPPLRHRLRRGVRHSHNWFQLARFGAVGASGYVVNLLVFALCLHALGIHYQAAAVVAFVVSVANNFWWNRRWTFTHARDSHAAFQAARFFAVSVVAFGFSFLVLTLLVDGFAVAKVLAQAVAIVTATPLSFLGQKLWSFRG